MTSVQAFIPVHTGILDFHYDIQKDLGDGSFGYVRLARVRSMGSLYCKPNSLVAIKSLKRPFVSSQDYMRLREVIFLQKLPSHQNLVKTYDILWDEKTKLVHIIMENMEINLYQLIKSRNGKQFSPQTIQYMLKQMFKGLEHIHKHGFFHRDIKPENILVDFLGNKPTSSEDCVSANEAFSRYKVKIADFGLAREIKSSPPYTNYVSTRWYRPPEILLGGTYYSTPVDIWAIGAVIVEMVVLKPLFPGKNGWEQIWMTSSVLGTPDPLSIHNNKLHSTIGGVWAEAVTLSSRMGFTFPDNSGIPISNILEPPRSPLLVSLIQQCLKWDPLARSTASELLEHPYFTSNKKSQITNEESCFSLPGKNKIFYTSQHRENYNS